MEVFQDCLLPCLYIYSEGKNNLDLCEILRNASLLKNITTLLKIKMRALRQPIYSASLLLPFG